MKPFHFVLVAFSLIFVNACHHKKDTIDNNVKIQQGEFQQVIEEPEPPPPSLTSKFRSVVEWLSKLAITDKPDSAIVYFRLSLFEHGTNYILLLTGSKNHHDHDTVLLDYQPSDMYYPLPQNEYSKLNREQAWKKITPEIKEFLTSETGQLSFFKKAKAIVTDFNGENLVE